MVLPDWHHSLKPRQKSKISVSRRYIISANALHTKESARDKKAGAFFVPKNPAA
jgi:hypothetical protein